VGKDKLDKLARIRFNSKQLPRKHAHLTEPRKAET
jgi:hypothetical protein